MIDDLIEVCQQYLRGDIEPDQFLVALSLSFDDRRKDWIEDEASLIALATAVVKLERKG